MKKIVIRLDRLVDHMIDADSLVFDKGRFRPVQIKTIFDNLRYYTVLAFLAAGVQLLARDGAPLSFVAAVILGCAAISLSILVFAQTSYIALAASFGVLGALLAPRTAVRFRRRLRSNDRILKMAAFAFVLPIVGGTVVLATALLNTLSRVTGVL